MGANDELQAHTCEKMLEFYGDVANNVVQANSQHLTEQWKKGELKTGWYYVNYYSIDGAVMQEYLPTHNGFGYDEKNLVQEVLAPVPSYEEWQEMKAFCEEFNALDVAKENQQLKELLSVCREMLEEYRFSEGDFTIGDNLEMDTSLLLKMINNVIGEKK